VSGTTGTGTRFVAAVTISGGAITAVNGLNVSGSYSVNPNNPASEPVSGAGLSGAILALGIGVNTVGILVPDWSANGTGTYSNPQVTRYGSGAGCSLNFTWSDASLLQINPSGGNVTIGPANTVSGANNMAFGENNTVATTGGYGMAFGNNNMVSGLAGMAFGTGNVASGVGGAVHGNGASDRGRYGVFAFTTSYKTVPGDAQEATQLLRGSSSATGAIRLTADGGAANSGNTVNLPSNTAYAVSLTLIGIDLTASGNASMVYQAQGLLYQASGVATTTYASGTIGTVLNKGTGLAAPPTLTADTANGGLNVSLTPPNAHTWDWVARVTTVEVQ